MLDAHRRAARDHRIIQAARAGEPLRSIGERFGLTGERVRQITVELAPDVGVAKQAKRDEVQARWAADRVCLDCGVVRDVEKPRGPGRCKPCSNAHVSRRTRVWTHEEIIEAMRDWHRLYGRAPAAADWNSALARANGRPDRAERYESGRWPPTTTVQGRFGSWSAAITAAGFPPNPTGGPAHEARRAA